MKSYFIGHGSPMNAIQKNAYTEYLSILGSSIDAPECIIVFSAHWLTHGTYITGSNNPKQIYDFYGFPEELYRLTYKPNGMHSIAQQISKKIPEITVDDNRGIDHAAWAVIKHMYPLQNIPVIEMSLNIDYKEQEHYALGKKIAKLDLSNVLFIGSGNLIHNLYEVDFSDNPKPFIWACEINDWIITKIKTNKTEELVEAKKYMPNYKRAAPSDDHYLPLLYILGLQKNSIKIEFNEIQNGSISMLSISVD